MLTNLKHFNTKFNKTTFKLISANSFESYSLCLKWNLIIFAEDSIQNTLHCFKLPKWI